jgi:hypothetical protein
MPVPDRLIADRNVLFSVSLFYSRGSNYTLIEMHRLLGFYWQGLYLERSKQRMKTNVSVKYVASL